LRVFILKKDESGLWGIIVSKTMYININEANDQRLELELIQTQMAQKRMLQAEVGMRVRCANKASAE
jgi:hypothetical protein